MPTYRADFDLRGGISLPENSGPQSLARSVAEVRIQIFNAPAGPDGHTPHLIAQVIGPAETIGEAADVLREHLARELDAVAYVTRFPLWNEECTRVMEWEAGQRQRRGHLRKKFDPNRPPLPDLRPELLASASAIGNAIEVDAPVRRALQAFRHGLIAEQPEEQFQNFWQAFETIAENQKTIDRVPVVCPRCQTPTLVCNSCHESPTRRPMAQQAMRDLLGRLRTGGQDLYKLLADIRNHLVHGGSKSKIKKRFGVDLAHAVNLIGEAAWYAIQSSLPATIGMVTYMESTSVVSRSLIAVADVILEHTEDREHPSEEKLPKAEISLNIRFTSRPDQLA